MVRGFVLTRLTLTHPINPIFKHFMWRRNNKFHPNSNFLYPKGSKSLFCTFSFSKKAIAKPKFFLCSSNFHQLEIMGILPNSVQTTYQLLVNLWYFFYLLFATLKPMQELSISENITNLVYKILLYS